MWNFYENPWPALTVGIVILALGAALGRGGIKNWGAALMAAGLFISVGGLVLERLVRTDYERINHILHLCRNAATKPDIAVFDRWICPDYSDSVHTGKEQVLVFIRQVIDSGGVQRVRFRSIELSLNGRQANTRLDMLVQTNAQNVFTGGGLFFVGLNVSYRKDNQKGWCVSGAELESVNDQPLKWKSLR